MGILPTQMTYMFWLDDYLAKIIPIVMTAYIFLASFVGNGTPFFKMHIEVSVE